MFLHVAREKGDSRMRQVQQEERSRNGVGQILSVAHATGGVRLQQLDMRAAYS